MSSQWDELDGELQYSAEDEAKHKRLDYLIHRVFCQNEDGRELIELWTEALILRPVHAEGADLYSLGLQEGIKTHIRGIIQTIRSVEDE